MRRTLIRKKLILKLINPIDFNLIVFYNNKRMVDKSFFFKSLLKHYKDIYKENI